MQKQFTLDNCRGCKFFDGGLNDSDTGYYQAPICGASAQLFDQGDVTEQAALMFEAILFQLSELNNCPMRRETKRSITGLKASRTA